MRRHLCLQQAVSPAQMNDKQDAQATARNPPGAYMHVTLVLVMQDTLVISAVVAACTLFIFFYWLYK